MDKKGRWAKIALEMPENPKILCLSDRAFRVYVEMILWSAKHLTDGFIPLSIAKEIFNLDSTRRRTKNKLTVIEELTQNSSDAPSLIPIYDDNTGPNRRAIEHESTRNRTRIDAQSKPDRFSDRHAIKTKLVGYQINNFCKYQTPKAEQEERSRRLKANGRKGGRPRNTPVNQKKENQDSNQLGFQIETKSKAQLRIKKKELTIKKNTTLTGSKKRTTKKRGTRLPNDWQPDEKTRKWTIEALAGTPLNPSEILFQFRNYWQAKTGQNATKLDWNLTWQNWIATELKWYRQRSTNGYKTQSQILAEGMKQAAAADSSRDNFSQITAEGVIDIFNQGAPEPLRVIAGGCA